MNVKAISDSSWSTFTTMLSYKSNWYGKELVKIGRWYLFSKTCSN
ncbi:MAG: zinc ribbon domain-containing protein, partial [Psychrobacter sp.]